MDSSLNQSRYREQLEKYKKNRPFDEHEDLWERTTKTFGKMTFVYELLSDDCGLPELYSEDLDVELYDKDLKDGDIVRISVYGDRGSPNYCIIKNKKYHVLPFLSGYYPCQYIPYKYAKNFLESYHKISAYISKKFMYLQEYPFYGVQIPKEKVTKFIYDETEEEGNKVVIDEKEYYLDNYEEGEIKYKNYDIYIINEVAYIEERDD